MQIAYSHDAAACRAFAEQAAEDWRRFLAMRSCELRPGARLVVLTMAIDDSGDFGYRPVVDALYGTLVDMVDHGLIRKEEVRRMVIPTVGRTRAQFTEPFAKTGHFSDLSLENFELFHGEDRIWAQFEASDDPHAFGAEWAVFAGLRYFRHSRPAWMKCRATHVGQVHGPVGSRYASRLSAAPVRMTIPLAQMTLIKANSCARKSGAITGQAM